MFRNIGYGARTYIGDVLFSSYEITAALTLSSLFDIAQQEKGGLFPATE